MVSAPCKTCGGKGKAGWTWGVDPKTGEAQPETLTQPNCVSCGGTGKAAAK